METSLIVLIVVLVIVVLYGIMIYNGLISIKNQVENSWAQIDVQLKRRCDLIPNLINTVKGYAKHERETLESVTKARTSIMNSNGAAGAAEGNNMLTDSLKSIFAVAESYPDLKANTNFLELQTELGATESKISAARQYFNDSVMEFNTKIENFPEIIIAKLMSLKEKELFEATEAEKKVVKVEF